MRMESVNCVRLLKLLLLLLLVFIPPVRGYYEVKINNDSYHQYDEEALFARPFANLPSGGIDGHLFRPVPANSCSYIDPPPAIFANSSWFALVDDYSACPLDMVTYVRNAGYKLIITSSINNSHRSVTKEVSNTQFPIVIVTEGYADYLRDNVTSELDDPVTVHVEGDIIVSVVVVTVPFAVFLVFGYIFCVLGCVVYVRRRRNDDFETRLNDIEERRRNFEHHQRRERMARQELIESILRQLQDLQLDLRLQVPLGAEETRLLPRREYHAGTEVCDTCAICVEDFAEGEMVRVLPCNHVFHPPCIDEWLSNHSSLCPLCKKEVPRQRGPNAGRNNAPAVARPGPLETDETTDTSTNVYSSMSSEREQLVTQNNQRYGSV